MNFLPVELISDVDLTFDLENPGLVVAEWEFYCGCAVYIEVETGEFWMDPYVCYNHKSKG